MRPLHGLDVTFQVSLLLQSEKVATFVESLLSSLVPEVFFDFTPHKRAAREIQFLGMIMRPLQESREAVKNLWARVLLLLSSGETCDMNRSI